MDPFLARNLVYGIQDSLVSTAGVVIGTSLAGLASRDVLVAGVILVIVESMSMAFGSFVSEDSFMIQADIAHDWRTIVKYSAAMLGAYVAAGALVMLPFLLDVRYAWQSSAALSLGALWALMYAYQRPTRRQRVGKSITLTVVAAAILALSVISGKLLRDV